MILSETQEIVRDTVRAMARERIAPNAQDWEEAGAYPRLRQARASNRATLLEKTWRGLSTAKD